MDTHGADGLLSERLSRATGAAVMAGAAAAFSTAGKAEAVPRRAMATPRLVDVYMAAGLGRRDSRWEDFRDRSLLPPIDEER